MMRWICKAAVLSLALGLSAPAYAQDQTLADIRQELSLLYVDVQRLRTELSTTGAATAAGGTSALERLNAIEQQLQRLTAKTEELEFRVNRITVDGTNRIGDLEFRLCELEAQCDIAMLGDTPDLGGVDSAAAVPTPHLAPQTGGPQLAIGERADFERASEALAAGDFQSAADLFAAFAAAYPGGPLSANAQYHIGEAMEGLGETSDAARAYLEAFSGAPDGDVAPASLYRLGRALGQLGQTADACVTLNEVSIRFPSDEMVADAQAQMRTFGCP